MILFVFTLKKKKISPKCQIWKEDLEAVWRQCPYNILQGKMKNSPSDDAPKAASTRDVAQQVNTSLGATQQAWKAKELAMGTGGESLRHHPKTPFWKAPSGTGTERWSRLPRKYREQHGKKWAKLERVREIRDLQLLEKRGHWSWSCLQETRCRPPQRPKGNQTERDVCLTQQTQRTNWRLLWQRHRESCTINRTRVMWWAGLST